MLTRIHVTVAMLAGVVATWLGLTLFPPTAQAQQAPEWRELGGINGVELYEVRTRNGWCYVTSAGGVSCK